MHDMRKTFRGTANLDEAPQLKAVTVEGDTGTAAELRTGLTRVVHRIKPEAHALMTRLRRTLWALLVRTKPYPRLRGALISLSEGTRSRFGDTALTRAAIFSSVGTAVPLSYRAYAFFDVEPNRLAASASETP
jgi:hypothetical protein